MTYLTAHCSKGGCLCSTCSLAPSCHLCPCKGTGPGNPDLHAQCTGQFAKAGCYRYEQTAEAHVEELYAMFETRLQDHDG